MLVVIFSVKGLSVCIHTQDRIKAGAGCRQIGVCPIDDYRRLTGHGMETSNQIEKGFLRQGAICRLCKTGRKARMEPQKQEQPCTARNNVAC